MINEGQSHKRERLMQTPYTGTEAVSKLLRSFGQISEAVSRFGNTLNDIHISATNIEHEFRNLASMMSMSRYTLSQMRPGSGGSSGGGYQGGSYVEELQTYEFMQRAKAAIRKRLRAEDKDLAAPDYAEQLTEYGNFLKAKQAVRELFAPKDNRQEFNYKKAFNEYVEFLDAKEAEQKARQAKKENNKQDKDFYGDNLKKYLDFLGRKEQYMTEFENRQRSRKQFDIYPDLLKKHKDYLAKKLQNEMEHMDQLLQLRNANAILEKAFNKQIYSFTSEAARAGQQGGAKGTDSSKYVSEDLEKFANAPEVGEGKAAYITMDLETGAPGGVNIGDDRYKEEADILQFAVEFRDKFGKVLDRVNAFFTPEGGIQLPKEAGTEGNEDKFASFREDFKKATKTTAKEANKEFLEKFAKYGDKNTVTLVKTSFDAEFASKNKRQKTQDLSETFKTLFGKSNKTLDIEKAFEALMKAQENRSPTKTSELQRKFLAQIPEGESRDKSRYKFKIEYMASALESELATLAAELEETSNGALSFHNALEDVRVESLLFLYAQRELLKFAKVKKPVDKEATEAAKKNTKETKENTASTQKNSKGSPPPGRTNTASVNTGGVQQVEIVAPLPLPVKIVEGGGGGSSPTFQMPDIGAMLEQGIALREKLRKQHAEDAEHKKAQKEKEAQKAAAENPDSTSPAASTSSTASTTTTTTTPERPKREVSSAPAMNQAAADLVKPIVQEVQKTAQAATNISRDPLRMQVGPHGNLMEDNEDPKSFRVFHKTKAGTLSKKARIFDKREEAEDFFRKNEGVEIEASYSGGRKKRYIPGKSLAETEASTLNPTNFETPLKGDFQTEPKRDISVEQQTAKEASAAAAEQQKKTGTALVALSQATRELVEIVQKNTSVIPVGSVSPRGALVPANPPGSPPASPPPPKGPEIQDAEWSIKNPEKKEKEKGYDGPEDLSFMEALSFSFDRLTGAAYERGYDPNKTFDDRKASFDKYVDDLRDALDKLVFDIMHAGDRIKIEPEAAAPSAASNTGYQGGATVTGGWNGWDMDPGTPSSGGPSSPAAPGNTNTPQLPGPSSPGSLPGPGGSSPPPGSPPSSPAPGASAPQPEAPKGPMPFNPNMRAEEIMGFESGYVPTEDELKKAFREKSKEHHPDRGGSTYNMSRINAAQQYLKTGKYEGWDKEREVAKGSYADALRQAGYETEAAAFEESLKKGTEYKATGGSVNNDKAPDKGTDTVDAKLTPGEFIVRKEKASKYAKFLQALNNGKLDETLNKKGGIVNYLSGGGFATATATASGSGGFGGPPRYGPPAPPVSPPPPPAPPPPPPPSGGGPLVPANRFPPPANFPTPLPVKIDTATTVPVKFVQTGWWSGKTWQKKDREVDPKKAPPINDPRVHGHRGDIFAPLKTWMHNFIETTRVGYIAKSFMALGQALQSTMNTMAGFVKAASPDTFSTLTGSLQLLTGAIGIQFIPIILRISAVIQGWANDILMGKGVLGAFFQKVGEMLNSIDAETLEGFVGIGLVVAGIVAMAPAIGIVTSVLGIFASAISVIVSAFSIAINVIMGFGKMLVWAVRALAAFGTGLFKASGGAGIAGFTSRIAMLVTAGAALLGTFKSINDWWNKEKLKEAKKASQSLEDQKLEQTVLEGDPEQKFAQERAEAAKKEGKDKAGVVEQLKKEEEVLYQEAEKKYAEAKKQSMGTGMWDKNTQVRPVSETEAYKEYQALKRKQDAIRQQREIEEGKRTGFTKNNKEAAEEYKEKLRQDYAILPGKDVNKYGQTKEQAEQTLQTKFKEYDDAVIRRDMARQEGKPLVQPVNPNLGNLGGGPVDNLVGGVMGAMPAIPEIPGLKGLMQGNLGKAFADIKKKMDNAFNNMAGNQKGKFMGPPIELMDPKLRKLKEDRERQQREKENAERGVAASFQNMKAQSSFSSVEEAYKKIQVAALGDDPMTAELKKLNEVGMVEMLKKLEEINNNANNNANKVANAGNIK